MDETIVYAGTAPDALDPREHDALIGHEEARRLLQLAASNDRFPQAWLLQGPEGVGKATFAWHFARRLVEIGDVKDDPLPPEIIEKYARGSQAQIYDITLPLDDKGGFKTQIPIDAMRTLNEKLTLSATEGAWRVVIIDPAEAMNANAANALLKMLEEPPKRVLFFLVSHAPHKLLPTIHSRCQKLRFHELSQIEMEEIWPLVTDQSIPEATRFQLAEGSMRMALSLSEDMSLLYQDMVAIVAKGVSPAQIAPITARIQKGKRAESIERASLLFQLLFGRLARVAAGVQQGNEAENAAAQKIAGNLSAWAKLAQEVQLRLDDAARLNLDAEVNIMAIWLSIQDNLRQI